MESIAEIQDMRVSELKDFLRRNDVNLASIVRSDGSDGPPRKSDLLGAALHVRSDYDNPQASGPTSPKNPRNIFQSGYSPQSARTLSVEEGSERRTSPRRRTSDVSTNADMNSARKRTTARASEVADDTITRQKKLKPRRRSSGWINPAFNPQLTPKSSATKKTIASKKQATPGRTLRVAEEDHVVEVPYDSFGDVGDQVIASDYDSTGSAPSGGDSDGGSVIDTDDDEGNSNKFKSMKVYEIRSWLNDHDVTFNHRSKKAELISLATAHALYLENIASAAKEQPKRKTSSSGEPDDDETTAFVEDEVEKSVPKPVTKEKRRSRSRKSMEVVEVVENQNKSDIDAGKAKENKPYRRSRSRVIAAPLPDDDKDTEVEKAKEDEIVPVVKPRRVKKHHSRKEDVVKKSAWPAFRLPSVRMPTISITRRGVTLFVATLLVALLIMSLANVWVKSKWPFCDTGNDQGIMADGSECHPCPINGICENGKLTCLEGYFQSGHRCLEDAEVSRYADHLERKIVRLLTLVKGKYQCGERSSAGLTEIQIRESVDPRPKDDVKSRRKPRKLRFDPSKFDAAFKVAMESLRSNLEDDVDHNVLLRTYETREGKRSISCICRQFLWQHVGYVLLVAVLFLMIARWRIKRYFRKREEARVEELYEAALEVLREVRVNFVEDDKGEAFMIDTQLREELLGRTTNEKVKLWVKVENLLRADSRVLRSGPRSIKGMPCYVYEWRGNLRRPSMGSGGREGFRGFNGPDTESRRRLSFGSASRRHSGGYESSPLGGAAGSPLRRRPSISPSANVSPGYRNMLNFWNRK